MKRILEVWDGDGSKLTCNLILKSVKDAKLVYLKSVVKTFTTNLSTKGVSIRSRGSLKQRNKVAFIQAVLLLLFFLKCLELLQ